MRSGAVLAGLAAIIVWSPASAAPDDLATARAFVRGLYGAYHHGDGPDYLGRQAAGVFAPPLLALIRRDAATTPAGDVGALDGDPICDCQDSGGLRNVEVNVAGGTGGRALATVRFQLSSEWRTVALDLVVVHGHWRVSDVHSADMPSLAGLLSQSLSGRHPRK